MARSSERRPGRETREAGAEWQSFHRARHALWLSIALLIGLGALVHDWTRHSLAARLLWSLGALLFVGLPLIHLLGFKCPRCRGVFLATGSLRDFLGLGRILWGSRCGQCALPAGDTREVSHPPSSRPT
jgi:hypothetical protein